MCHLEEDSIECAFVCNLFLVSRHHFVACRARLRLLALSVHTFLSQASTLHVANRLTDHQRLTASQSVYSQPGTKCTFYDALFKAPRLHRALAYKLCETIPIYFAYVLLSLSIRPVLFWRLESLTHSVCWYLMATTNNQGRIERQHVSMQCDLAGISHLIGRQDNR